jgi:transposase
MSVLGLSYQGHMARHTWGVNWQGLVSLRNENVRFVQSRNVRFHGWPGGPMETERIELSQRERDWLKVLHEVEQKHLTQREAAQRLKRTDRQVRRMLLRIREHGDGGIVHRLRGRPSNRKLAGTWEQKILARVGQRYADFGPTLAAEQLAKEGVLVSRETLRQWMIQAAL